MWWIDGELHGRIRSTSWIGNGKRKKFVELRKRVINALKSISIEPANTNNYKYSEADVKDHQSPKMKKKRKQVQTGRSEDKVFKL